MKKLTRALLLSGLSLLLVGCLGPKPVVREFTLHSPEAGSGDPYSVEVVLVNNGPGSGEVALEVELLNKKTGEIIAQEMRDVDLAKDATLHLQVDLDLPEPLKNLEPQDIEAHVDAHYPIQ